MVVGELDKVEINMTGKECIKTKISSSFQLPSGNNYLIYWKGEVIFYKIAWNIRLFVQKLL